MSPGVEPAPEPRSLAEAFRGWSDDRLAALLAARPDLASPAPADSAQLATRAATRTSLVRAVDDLTAYDLDVLEAVLQTGPTTVSALAGTVTGDVADDVTGALDRLRERALVWGDEQVRAVSVLTEALPSPAGPADPAGALAALTPDQREHLAAIARGDAGSAPRVLIDRGVLVPIDDGRRAAIPWTVRRLLGPPPAAPPALALSTRGEGLVDRAAAGAAFDLVRRTELLLDHWGTHPAPVLKTGGLAVRDLRAAAELLHTETTVAALVVETAHAAGLLAQGEADEISPAWLPSHEFDAWQRRPPAERWQALAQAWWDSPRLVALVGERDQAGKTINALASGLSRPWLPRLRRDVLSALADTAPGEVLAAGTGRPSLLARLAWQAPRRPARQADPVLTVLAEAALVGLVALDGVSAFGRELLATDGRSTDGRSTDGLSTNGDPAAVLAPLLPDPVDHVLLQADLTAVAPGPLETELAQRLAVVADVESRGGATVYRFTADSVRRGLDAGWSAAELTAWLHASSRTPVPQALEYLVADVARRFGTLRLGAVEAFLLSDDEAALTELLADPAAASLRLRRIAPTVVVTDVPLHVVLPRLRELGRAPVVEAADGTVRLARPDAFRARTPRRGDSADRQAARRIAHTGAAVRTIRAGDRVAAHRPRTAVARTPADVMGLLRGAAADAAPVWIGYVDNHGRTIERVVTPVHVEAGQLLAREGPDEAPRPYSIHRIGRAALAEASG